MPSIVEKEKNSSNEKSNNNAAGVWKETASARRSFDAKLALAKNPRFLEAPPISGVYLYLLGIKT